LIIEWLQDTFTSVSCRCKVCKEYMWVRDFDLMICDTCRSEHFAN
jgi:Zn finger protein HypA/HybF involved in hydrogenase expression